MGYKGKQKLQNNLANLIAKNPDVTTQQTSQVTTSVTVPPSISVVETVTTLPSTNPVSPSNYSQPITYLRSRNVAFDATSLRPLTRFYPFLAGINISSYIIPKLLEIQMTKGSFLASEDVVSDATFTSNSIRFRLCSPNHKLGPFLTQSGSILSLSSSTFSTNPYNGQPIQTEYTSSSTFLNVDTRSLQLPSDSIYYGSVAIGMKLIGVSSRAEATITNIRLISDENGRLLGSFYIPDPNRNGNPKFTTGSNMFTLIDVSSINNTKDSTSVAESVYVGSGILETVFNNTSPNSIGQGSILTPSSIPTPTSISSPNPNTLQISGTNIVTTRVETIVPAYTINVTEVVNVTATVTTEIGITFKQDKKLTARFNILKNERDNLQNKTNKTNKQKQRLTFVENEISILEEIFEETTTKLTPKQIQKKTNTLKKLRNKKINLTNKKSKDGVIDAEEQEELDNIQDKIDYLVNILEESGVANP